MLLQEHRFQQWVHTLSSYSRRTMIYDPLFSQSDFDSWNSGGMHADSSRDIIIGQDQHIDVRKIDWKRLRKDETYQLAILTHRSHLIKRIPILGKNWKPLIRDDYTRIGQIINVTPNMCDFALYISPNAMEHINIKLPFEIYKRFITKYPHHFVHIKDPCHALCKLAVTLAWENIEHIENQTHEIQLRAIRKNPMAIQHCINPHKKLKWMAIHKNPWSIKHIENRSETMVLVAVQLAIQTNPDSPLIDSIPKKFIRAHDYVKLIRT